MHSATPPAASSGGRNDWSVVIEEQGRGGTIHYRESGGSIPLSWEFGGEGIVAIIYFDDEATWRTRYPWAGARRSEILQRIAAEAIRQKTPGSRAEIKESSGWINLHQGPPQPLTARETARVSHLKVAERKTKIMTIVAIIILLLAVAAFGLKTLFSVRSSTGAPLGLSVRTPDHVATLIQTLEPYIPSLHRNADKDRYRLALLLTPLQGGSAGKMIPLAQERRAQEFTLAKLLGCDGKTVWYSFNGIGGVDLKSGKLIGEAELRRANPSLDENWDDQRRMEFTQRLRVTSADRQRAYEVIPETLRAEAVDPRTGSSYPFDLKPQDFLSAGVRPSPTAWIGLLSAKSAAREYKPGSRLSRLNRADDAKEARSLYRSQLGPEVDRGNREILTQERISPEEYFNAAFVRAGAEAEPLRFSDPDGFLMLYTSAPGLGGTTMVAGVDAEGTVRWKTDTGIDRFKLSQILPGAGPVALIGTRPPVPDKLSEPVVVSIDPRTGAAATASLWQ